MGLFTRKERHRLDIGGMTCGNCVKHVTEALAKVDGVHDVEVDLDEERALVKTAPGTSDDELVAAVVAAGYTAKPGPDA